MWKTVCQKCGWASGEAYLKSVAQAIGKLHEEDNAGHKVAMKQVSGFGSGVEEEENSGPQRPEPSKP
jgi:hypothetical protein